MRNKRTAIFTDPTAWIVLLSLIWAAVLAFDLLPILRGGFGWEWNYKPVLDRFRVLPIVLATGVYVSAGLWLKKQVSAIPLVVWAFLGSICLSLAAVHVRGDALYRLYSITVSGRAGGWHMAAAGIHEIAQTLRDWPQFMLASTAFSTHMGISPPGMVLAYYAAGSVLDRVPPLAASLQQPVRGLLCQYISGYSSGDYASSWIGILTPVWGALTILPLYGLGREVFGETTARTSVLWWTLVPSFLMFTPLPNVLYPLPSLIVITILWRGLRKNQVGWVLAAGVLMSLLTFITFTFLPLLLLAGLLTLGVYWLRWRQGLTPRLNWYWPLAMGLAFGVGLSSVWLAFYAGGGAGFWSIWQTAQQAHLALDRPYWPWLALHLNDFFMFSGLTFALLAAVAVRRAFRRVRSPKAATYADVMILAFGLTVLIVDLSGTLRGEAGRILLFLTPWLLLAAAYGLREDNNGGWLMAGTQAILTVVVVLCLQVLAPEFKAHAAPAPPPVKYAASAPTVHPSGAEFGDEIRLLAFSGKIDTQLDAQGQAQPVMYLWLTWEASTYVDLPYTYEVQPIAPAESSVSGSTTLAPFGDAYPTTCWKPADGELTDRIKVPLSSSAAGEWWADLSLAEANTGKLVDIHWPDGSDSQQLRLGPFQNVP